MIYLQKVMKVMMIFIIVIKVIVIKCAYNSLYLIFVAKMLMIELMVKQNEVFISYMNHQQ